MDVMIEKIMVGFFSRSLVVAFWPVTNAYQRSFVGSAITCCGYGGAGEAYFVVQILPTMIFNIAY